MSNSGNPVEISIWKEYVHFVLQLVAGDTVAIEQKEINERPLLISFNDPLEKFRPFEENTKPCQKNVGTKRNSSPSALGRFLPT